jgi:Ca2+-binding EF-hand superfamily protein
MTSPNQSIPRSRPFRSDELAEAEEHFDVCDLDGDQHIDFTEYSKLLDSLGVDMSLAQRRRHFDAIDANRDGTIDRREFMVWLGSDGS